MPRVLVVEDERPIAEILRFHLERDGFEVAHADTGPEALARALAEPFDLLILDLMLPGLPGLEVCRRLRQEGRTLPILMLTAKDEEIDKVVGLEVGADDYVTKPFSMRELLARVHALLRRFAAAERPAPPKLWVGPLELDLLERRVTKNGRLLDLSPLEFLLLRQLMSEPGRVFSRAELLAAVWEEGGKREPRAVDVAIRRLREKVEDEPSRPQLIRTRRGGGYYLDGEAGRRVG